MTATDDEMVYAITHKTQAARLAAFYRAYELVRFGRPATQNGEYSTAQAIAWGKVKGLYPVPAGDATGHEITGWEEKLGTQVGDLPLFPVTKGTQ